MADIHVLDGNLNSRWRVAMHFVVPSGNNSANILWTDVIINSGIGGNTQLPDGDGSGGTIDVIEKTAIQNGIIFEHIALLRIDSGGVSAADIRATLRQFYGSERADILMNLQRKLKYFGAIESEA